MRYISKSHILIILISGFILSCFPEEDEIVAEKDTDTFIPTISNIESSYFDALDLENAEVKFTINADPAIVKSVTIERTFNGRRSQKSVVAGPFTQIPAVVSISAADAVEGLSNTSLDDLEVGDNFLFEVIVETMSGKRSRSNAILNAAVSCPSALAGTYITSTSGQSTDSGPSPSENPISNYPYEVTLTETSVSGVYTISDFSGGLYELWYDIYGITGDSPGTIKDICNQITFTNTVEPFGTAVTGSGTVNTDTGVITISAKNGYDDTWTIVLTPKP